MIFRPMVPWARLALGVLCSSLGLGACSGSTIEGPESFGSTTLPLTAVVPTSRTCTHDVVSSGCFDVPPKPVPGCSSLFDCRPPVCLPGRPCNSLPSGIDGVLSPHAYDGATELPYTDQALKAEAKVRVKAVQYDSGYNKGQGYMNVYLEDMPWVPYNPSIGGDTLVDRGPLYVVYVDFNRFNGADASVGAEDRFFVIDVTGVQPATIYREDAPGAFTSIGTAAFHAGTCAPDPSTAYIWRCGGELRIPLGNDMKRFAAPNEDVDPGIGFAVYPFAVSGKLRAGLPEIQVAGQSLPIMITDRRAAVSLLFAKPKGYQLQYMTWNIRRSSVSLLAGDFSKTPDDAVGGLARRQG
jgi:hypothetical protein